MCLAKQRLVSIVIPSFNDRELIKPFYEDLVNTLEKDLFDDFELIYVDDGSTDGSQATLIELSELDDRVCFVELYRNFGQQRALFAGLEQAKGWAVVTIDGDHQYPASVILDLIHELRSGCEIVSGIRKARKDAWTERFVSRIGNILIRRILGAQISDFGSVKAFSRSLVNEIVKLKHHFSDVYPTALSLHPTLVEIPVTHLERRIGQSKWNFWMRLKLYLDLYVVYGDDQFQFPFKIGVVTACSGVISGILLIAYKGIFGHAASFAEIFLLTFIVSALGVSASTWSLSLSILVRLYKQNAFSGPYVIKSINRK